MRPKLGSDSKPGGKETDARAVEGVGWTGCGDHFFIECEGEDVG